jgi:hypothetical protein
MTLYDVYLTKIEEIIHRVVTRFSLWSINQPPILAYLEWLVVYFQEDVWEPVEEHGH